MKIQTARQKNTQQYYALGMHHYRMPGRGKPKEKSDSLSQQNYKNRCSVFLKIEKKKSSQTFF